jgi:hypothetical protein
MTRGRSHSEGKGTSMKLTTRTIRNASFATMLAVMPLAQQEPLFAEDCGPTGCRVCVRSAGGTSTGAVVIRAPALRASAARIATTFASRAMARPTTASFQIPNEAVNAWPTGKGLRPLPSALTDSGGPGAVETCHRSWRGPARASAL